MKVRNIWMTGFLCAALNASAQVGSSPSFASPFDFPLLLAGNFGELRANHFHGGLDIKTQGVEGKPIYAIEEGYVSRVSIAPNGYGNALYVTHPNGYTSVYGHLSGFAPVIARYVMDQHYEQERFDLELTFESSQFPVKRGELIAYSGNTGSSMGPHLHMEIRQTDTNEPTNPLPYYLQKIKDTMPPRATALICYPQEGRGVVNGSTQPQKAAISKVAGGRTQLSKSLTAWGEVTLGLKANDYMDGTNNSYGVYSVTLLVDGVEVFQSTVDRFFFDENRMINGWTDYEEQKRGGGWFMKSSTMEGNRLRMLKADAHRGVITISEERPYHCQYLLKDAHGNSSKYEFTITGKRQQIPAEQTNYTQLLRWNETQTIREPGMELVIPKGMLYESVKTQRRVYADSSDIAWTYRVHNKLVPLHTYCPLSIGLRRMPVADSTKYYIAQVVGAQRYYVGGTYEHGWLTGSVRELGTYTVAIDTIPPKAEPVGRNLWERNKEIVYRLSDGETGIQSFRGTIDGHYAFFTYNSMRRRLACRMEEARIEKGKRHQLVLEVTDHCGNVTTVKDSFYY